jgi:hypothetical protein
MAKAHLVIKEQSVSEKAPCTAVCRVEIKNAKIVFAWDQAEMGTLWVAPRGVCQNCIDEFADMDPGNRCYVFAVKDANADKH